jgi:glycosyltransferase involved in cell wall biosynthesis
MPTPFFSIIIPTFNSARTLQNALDSLYHQDMTDYEILIIDGQSRDNTLEIISKNAATKPFIKFISERDDGVYDAFNKGLQIASGTWIYFLGSDDRMHDSNVLRKVYEKIQKQYCDLIYGNVLFANSKLPYDGLFSKEKLLSRNISHQAIFYNINVFRRIGIFNTRYKIMADWEFNLRCFFCEGFSEVYLDLIVSDFALEGLSTQTDVLFLREILIPANIVMMNSITGWRYFRDIIKYDECWRLLRNSKIRTVSDLKSYSGGMKLPKILIKMLNHQRKIATGLLKNGFISKTCMFMSYLTNRLSI